MKKYLKIILLPLLLSSCGGDNNKEYNSQIISDTSNADATDIINTNITDIDSTDVTDINQKNLVTSIGDKVYLARGDNLSIIRHKSRVELNFEGNIKKVQPYKGKVYVLLTNGLAYTLDNENNVLPYENENYPYPITNIWSNLEHILIKRNDYYFIYDNKNEKLLTISDNVLNIVQSLDKTFIQTESFIYMFNSDNQEKYINIFKEGFKVISPRHSGNFVLYSDVDNLAVVLNDDLSIKYTFTNIKKVVATNDVVALLNNDNHVLLYGHDSIILKHQYTEEINVYLSDVDWNKRVRSTKELQTPLEGIVDLYASEEAIAMIDNLNKIITLGHGRFGGNIYQEYSNDIYPISIDDTKEVSHILSDNKGFTIINGSGSFSWGHWTINNRNELYMPSNDNNYNNNMPMEQEIWTNYLGNYNPANFIVTNKRSFIEYNDINIISAWGYDSNLDLDELRSIISQNAGLKEIIPIGNAFIIIMNNNNRIILYLDSMPEYKKIILDI